MLKVPFAHSCWSLAVVLIYVCSFISTAASSGSFRYLDKEYTLIQESRTFDQAAVVCRDRGERLVQIGNQAEQDFIHNSILKRGSSSYYIWLGATNIIGTKTFKWLDGSELIYSNWLAGTPDGEINQRNGIAMNKGHSNDGEWSNIQVSEKPYVLCEKPTVLVVNSNLLKPTDQFNATIAQINSQLSALSASVSTQRSEYLAFIGEVKESNDLTRDQIVRTQTGYDSKLNSLSELNAVNTLAIAELMRAHAEAVSSFNSSQLSANDKKLQLRTDIDGKLRTLTDKLTTDLNANHVQHVAAEVALVELIKSQAVKYSYRDKEYSLTREYKTFDEAVMICKQRKEMIVQVDSDEENNFIFNAIVKPSGHATWLGATNEIGTDTYKWLNGNVLTFSNWDGGFPNKDIGRRNGVLIGRYSGKWFDEQTNGTSGHVLCERRTVFALGSNLLKLQQQFKESLMKQANETANELALQKRQYEDLIAKQEIRLKRLEHKLIKTG